MTSHITVSASQSSASTTGFSTPSSSGSDDQSSGGFGAILDAIGSFGKSIIDGATQGGGTTPQTGFTHLGSNDADAATAKANAEALAKALATGTVSAPLASTAATDATGDGTDTTTGTPPKLLRDLINSLAELQKAQQDGTPVDSDLLKRVKTAIDAISNFLTTQQPIQAATTDPATGTDATSATTKAADPTAASPNANTDAAKATLAALTAKLEALSSSVSQTSPEASAKLDALAKSLDPAKLSADTMTQLGLDASGKSADPDLAAAINGLVNGKTTATTSLPQPALAAPLLKLPDGTALGSGQTASATTPASTTGAATATPSGKPSGSDGDTTTDASQKNTPSSSAATAARTAADHAKDVADTPAATSTSTTAPPAAAATIAQAQLAQTAYVPATAAAAAVALPQMAIEIARHVQQGDSHFQIKLDPADLGRVDVKLAFDASGAVSARVTVERPETLALLQRDAGSLSQALTQSGLDGSKTNLQFSLSQNPFAGQNGGNNGNASAQPQVADDDASADTIAPASVAVLYRGTATPSGLNIVV